ncbi:MAG: methanogenesis marker 3 protein [Candidatus Methanomethylophilaceae archaeon]|jgi:putative methanogenesis marker protein 3
MKVSVNGKEKILRDGATLKDAVEGENVKEGALIAVRLSVEKISETTDDFELVTPRGSMILHLDDGPDAEKWRSIKESVEGVTARWVTRKIVAFGAFPTDIKHDAADRMYRRFDCFFSLGGGDNHTTYMMIARSDHRNGYGAGSGRIGRITKGRHLMDELREGEGITEIRPVTSETSVENLHVTSDLSFPMEDGYSVETHVLIDLDPGSPSSAEHVLIATSEGTMKVTDSTGSYIASSENMDTESLKEKTDVREAGAVTVRNEGTGNGRIYIYKTKRQVAESHNRAGKVVRGMSLVFRASEDDTVEIRTNPPRALAVGMTQKEGEAFLSAAGIKQVRTGDVSDGAIIAEQTPERTLEVISSGIVETFGVPKDNVYRIEITAPDTVTDRYFRKVTGLSHKPIGSLKVQFIYDGAPMVTFYGDEMRGKSIFPQEPFEEVRRGDIGVTNQVRPYCGLIGIRLTDSKEFGPTGEENHGTNIVGKFVDDLDRLISNAEDEQTVYITEKIL